MRYLSFIVLFCIAVNSFAQVDSSILLNEVIISSSRSPYQSGLHSESMDSSEIERLNLLSLDQLLRNNTSITIKDYGPGQLSTITLRGGSSYHTAVLWNGFQIASPLHGLTDLTLADNLFFDQTSILYGGASTLWGSGAVSGTISLNNMPHFNTGLTVSGGAAFGSFSDYTQYAEIGFGNSNYYGNVKVINNDNENNYSYYDDENELHNQTHSNISHFSVFTEHYIKTGINSTLNFRLWHTYFDRQIPPAMQQVNSNAVQTDDNTRLSAEWKKVKENYQFNVRSAFFSEKEEYNDNYLNQPSNNNCNTLASEAIFEKSFLRRHLVQTGINNSTNFVDSSANLQNVSLNRLALFLLYRYQSENKKVDASASARKEFSTAGNSPMLYSAGLNFNLHKSVLLRTSFSKVFRYPTLNDLYWVPGGNTDLKSESGYNAEGGIQVEPLAFTHSKFSKMLFNFTGYYREINDWIIWYPSTGTLWRPQNLLEVKSRGLETSVNYTFSKRNFALTTLLSYNYTLSTNEKSVRPMDESYQKQLIYVPPHSANGRLTIGYKKFLLTTSVCYTGYRYTTSDNTAWLDDYTIINVEAAQIFAFKKIQSRIFFRINNLANTSYQSVENRPMPLRTFTGGISFTYKKSYDEKN